MTAGRAPPRDLRIARIAAGEHGRIGIEQLRACGLDKSAVGRRVEKGQLHRVHAGVYAVDHGAKTLHAQFMAAVLAGGEDADLSHWASRTCASSPTSCGGPTAARRSGSPR